MADPHNTQVTPSPTLVRAVRAVLRPLVRLLVGRGLTLPFMVETLKALYVEVAERHFPVPGRAPSDSRISLLTGVHRKDVRRLRSAEDPDQGDAMGHVSLGTQLVARWLADAAFTDGAGRPRVLPLRAPDGRASFERLAATVSRGDLRPRALLDELVRVGVVEVAADGQVILRVEGFVPEPGMEEQAVYFHRNVRDHMAACVHNLEGLGPPLFERSVAYHGLSTADIEVLSEQARCLGNAALQQLNRKALGMQRQLADAQGPRHRFNFGCYLLTAAELSEAEGGDDVVP